MPKIRAAVKKNNKYYIPKHRFYELYHYCLQYQEWLDEYNSIVQLSGISADTQPGSGIGDPTFAKAEKGLALWEKMEEVRKAAAAADPQLSKYILLAVTKEGASYQYLRNVLGMPCSRKMFYDRRRKFYWIMDKNRKNVSIKL